MRILIVSDIRLYREGLELILKNDKRLMVVGTIDTLGSALADLSSLNPEVVLVDVMTHDCLLDIKLFVEAAPWARVVALSVLEDDDEVIACAEAGVSGYVTRSASVNELVDAVQAIRFGELLCSPRLAGCLLRRVATLAPDEKELNPLAGLTKREISILELVGQGFSNKEIANRLSIQIATVKNHVHSILGKLNVQRRGEAAVLARKYLVVSLPRMLG